MAKEYLQSNGKLLMTANGELVQVPDSENLNDLADTNGVMATQSEEVTKEIEDLIVKNGVIDGSPRGVYTSLSALQTAYPSGASGVYLTSDNGHWYYWNGSAWTDGGVYQSSDDINQLKEDLVQLDKNDYIKIYNITMPSNRAVRFIPLAKLNDALSKFKISFDYESSTDMCFGGWRVVVYGGNNASGNVDTLLHTFSGWSFQKHFELEADISDANEYEYIQIFTEFIYDVDSYNDDIVLNNYSVFLNEVKTKIVGINTWKYSNHTSNYTWKSNLCPAYAKKEEILSSSDKEKTLSVLKQNSQLIVSFIDDDSNYCAPTIWGSILQDNSDVKIGFACITGYMNGTYKHDTTYKQMTLDQLKDFYKNGHEVYSHGWGGFSVSSLSETDLESECRKSKDWLRDNGFVRGSETIVYSGGANNDASQQNIVRGFYKYGVNAWGTGINSDIVYRNPLYISRVMGDTLSLAQLKQIVDNYISVGGILVLGFHSYELNKDADNNVAKIKDLITYIKGKNAKIVPIERAIRSVYGILAE